MHVVDLTRPLDESTPVYHDSRGYSDPPTRLVRWVGIGDELGQDGAPDLSPFQVTRLEIGLHTGTHVDAPAHFALGGATVEALQPADMVGAAIVVDLSSARGVVSAADLLPYSVAAAAGTIPLLLLANARLGIDAADEVIAWKRPLVCVFGSVDGDDPECSATARLLRAGIWLAVDLAPAARDVRDGDTLVVAPLALRGVEGALARVLAIRLPSRPLSTLRGSPPGSPRRRHRQSPASSR